MWAYTKIANIIPGFCHRTLADTRFEHICLEATLAPCCWLVLCVPTCLRFLLLPADGSLGCLHLETVVLSCPLLWINGILVEKACQ
jgi:hypothetical protein